jgi:8-amino-7-oxononanoate synthase
VSIGGFVAGKGDVIHHIRHHARSLIFTAAFPPSCAAVPLAAMEVAEKEPGRRERLWAITVTMRTALQRLGFDTGNSESPIIPLVIGSTEQACCLWRELFDRGIFTTPVVPPAVPQGRAMIRTSYMATHTDGHIDRILKALESAGKKLGIL